MLADVLPFEVDSDTMDAAVDVIEGNSSMPVELRATGELSDSDRDAALILFRANFEGDRPNRFDSSLDDL